MNYRQLISESWILTQKNRRLIIWYAFVPAILTTLVGILYLTYQIISTWRSKLFNYQGQSLLAKIFSSIIDLVEKDTQIAFSVAVVAVIIGLLYLTIPTICQAALISLSARINNRQEVRLIDGISYGLLAFLPLFKYDLLIKSFGLLGVITEAAFIGRNLGWLWLKILFIPLVIFSIFAFLMLLLFTYTEYYIVIDDEGMFAAMGKSSRLVVKHWPETIIIALLMVIIIIRVLLNAILVILVPTLIIIPAGYLTSVVLGKIGIILAAILGITALLITSYFAAIIEVFAKFVWVKTFLYLTSKEDLSPRAAG